MSNGLFAPDNASSFVQAMSALVHAQAGWLGAAANYQATQFKNLAVEIAAEGDAAVVREKQAAAAMLQNQYRKLLQEQHRVQQATAVLVRKGMDLRYLWIGEHLAHGLISVAWTAWNYFYMLLTGDARTAAIAVAVPAEATSVDNFTRGSGLGADKGVVTMPPPSITNVVQLATWCQKKNVVPSQGSRASQLFEAGLAAMQAKADEMTASLNKDLDQFRTSVFTTFDPLKVSSLDSATAAKASAMSQPNPIS